LIKLNHLTFLNYGEFIVRLKTILKNKLWNTNY